MDDLRVWIRIHDFFNGTENTIQINLGQSPLIPHTNVSFDNFKNTVLTQIRNLTNIGFLSWNDIRCICIGTLINSQENLNFALNNNRCGENQINPIHVVIIDQTVHNKKIKINALKNTTRIHNNIPNLVGRFLGGDSKFVNIKGNGKRKVRYQKNGRAYVIVNGKKIKLN